MRFFLTTCLLVVLSSATFAGSDVGLDLPVKPVKYGDKIVTQPADDKAPEPEPVPPAAEDDDGDDPRDTPPPTIYGEDLVGESDTIIFILDFSGSMLMDAGSFQDLDGVVKRGTRAQHAIAECARSIVNLAPNFHFNVYRFSCSVDQFAPKALPSQWEHKLAALKWLNSWFQPGFGATGTGPAVALACQLEEESTVVLLTDGAPNCGADGPEGHRAMIAASRGESVINVFGISAQGEWRAFCQSVASDSGGLYFDVP